MNTTRYSVGDLVDVDLGGGQFTAGKVLAVVPAAGGGVWEYDVQIHGGTVVSAQPRTVRPPATTDAPVGGIGGAVKRTAGGPAPRQLYPTPTRLALLAAIGTIHREGDGWSYVHWGDDCYCRGGRVTRKVTSAIEEMRAAGWIEPEEPRHWRLTDAGQAVLDAAGPRRSA